MNDLNYQIMWINKASKRLCNVLVSDRETAMRVAKKMEESPDTYDEILVTVRGDNGYFQPLD